MQLVHPVFPGKSHVAQLGSHANQNDIIIIMKKRKRNSLKQVPSCNCCEELQVKHSFAPGPMQVAHEESHTL